MPVWTLLIWLLAGAAAGFVTRKSAGGLAPFGLIGDLVIGSAGGVVGGYIAAMFVPATTLGLILTTIAAVVLAAVLILLSGNIKKNNGV